MFLFQTVESFSVDQDITDKYPSASMVPIEEDREIRQPKPWQEKLNVDVFLDLQQGYDNNVDLNSRRIEDAFLQSSANVDVIYNETDSLKIRGGIDVFDLTYYKHNVDNLLDVNPYIGFDYEIVPGLISKNRIKYDYFSYPNKKENTFSGLVLSTYLRHYIVKRIYHELGYEFLKRWYPDRKTTLANSNPSNQDRIDDRFRIKYKIGASSSRAFFSLSNEYSKNDSNERYQDYYDYWVYRLRPSVMYFFTEKFYTNVGFVYKYTHYKDRRSTMDSSKHVRDNTYMVNTSLYYDISKNTTFGITYSYNENTSNDPYQKYSGSTITGGVFYSF